MKNPFIGECGNMASDIHKTPSKRLGITGRFKRMLPLSPSSDQNQPSKRGWLLQDESPKFGSGDRTPVLSPLGSHQFGLTSSNKPITCRRSLIPTSTLQDFTPQPTSTGAAGSCLMGNAGIFNPVYLRVNEISPQEVHLMMSALQTRNCGAITSKLFGIPNLLNAVKYRLLTDIDKQCAEVCRSSAGYQSVLRGYRYDHLLEKNFYVKCVRELSSKIPFGFDVMATMASPLHRHTDSSVVPVAYAYSTLLKARNVQMSRLHNLVSLKLLHANAERTVFKSLSGISSSHSQALKQVSNIGQHFDTEIQRKVAEGGSFYFTGDNLDIMVRVRDQRLDTKDKSHHWYVTNLAFDRINFTHLPNVEPKSDIESVDDKMFFPDSPNDQALMLKSFRVLAAGVLIENFPALSWMKPFAPDHISHRYTQEMSKMSDVYALPIMFKDEKNYSDCQDILDQCETWLARWFCKALGKDSSKGTQEEIEAALKDLRIPYEGDQLTRVRLFYAKLLRAGVRYPSQQFEHIGPFVLALFHNKIDFLHKSYKQLYKATSTREAGTLKFFRERLRRTKVTGKVKDNLEAHEELIMLVGKAYLLEAACHFLGMDSDDAQPTAASYPKQPGKMNMETREKQFISLMDGFLNFALDNVLLTESVFDESMEDADKELHDMEYTDPDAMLNYVKHLLFRFMMLLNISDTCKEADPDRNLLNCKMMTWCALASSNKSKYAIENFNFVLQTQVLLTPQMSERVLTGRWVNLHGKIGENIENDRKQEHSVRVSKRMIKSVGSNKTQPVIRKFSLAAQGIDDIIENDNMNLNIVPRKTKRKKADCSEDLLTARRSIKDLDIFVNSPGRSFPSFPRIDSHPLTCLKKKKATILKFIKYNKRRLSAGMHAHIPPPESDTDSDEDH